MLITFKQRHQQEEENIIIKAQISIFDDLFVINNHICVYL